MLGAHGRPVRVRYPVACHTRRSVPAAARVMTGPHVMVAAGEPEPERRHQRGGGGENGQGAQAVPVPFRPRRGPRRREGSDGAGVRPGAAQDLINLRQRIDRLFK